MKGRSMPVEDHPVHPSTRKGADFRYGCWNRGEYASGYYAPNRVYGFDGAFSVELKWVRYTMSTPCITAQTGWAGSDPNCEGCKRRLTAPSRV